VGERKIVSAGKNEFKGGKHSGRSSRYQKTPSVAVVLGVVVLKEPLTVPKAVSTAAILVGVVLVKLA
jgi:uncharacterized membrane protein